MLKIPYEFETFASESVKIFRPLMLNLVRKALI